MDKLERLSDQSPETGWIRTWLDTVLELPWNTRTEDSYDIPGARAILDADHAGLSDVKDRIIEYLAVRKRRNDRGLGVVSGRRSGAVLALVGPVGFVREWVRRFALWVVLASLAYLTWWSLRGAQLGTLWSQPGKGGFPSFWQGLDLMVAMPVSWLPLAADYTRFSRGRAGAFWGTALGYVVPNIWLYALGAILLLSRGLADAPSVLTAIAAGGAGAAVALLALGVDETKEPFANVYSAAVSLQNVLPQVPQRLLVLAVAAVATAGAFVVDLVHYQDFLYLLGSFFVPLFGVLLAQWLVGNRHAFAAPELRPGQIAAWLAGFCLYQWLAPVGPSGWIDLVEHTHPGRGAVGGSQPAVFIWLFGAVALASVLGGRLLGRRR